MDKAQPKVKLKAGDDEKTFDLEHAQGILDLNRRNSTSTWVLTDPKYVLDDNGKIIPKSGSGASSAS